MAYLQGVWRAPESGVWRVESGVWARGEATSAGLSLPREERGHGESRGHLCTCGWPSPSPGRTARASLSVHYCSPQDCHCLPISRRSQTLLWPWSQVGLPEVGNLRMHPLSCLAPQPRLGPRNPNIFWRSPQVPPPTPPGQKTKAWEQECP